MPCVGSTETKINSQQYIHAFNILISCSSIRWCGHSSFSFFFFPARQNNWPPLPSFCPVGPCFYQDINVEISQQFQRIVTFMYYFWMCESLLIPGRRGFLSNTESFHLRFVTYIGRFNLHFAKRYRSFRNYENFESPKLKVKSRAAATLPLESRL